MEDAKHLTMWACVFMTTHGGAGEGGWRVNETNLNVLGAKAAGATKEHGFTTELNGTFDTVLEFWKEGF